MARKEWTRIRIDSTALPIPDDTAPPPPSSGAAFRSTFQQTVIVSGVSTTFIIILDKKYWTGRFITGPDGGDWWIQTLTETGPVSSVTINSISPAWTGVANGTMLDIPWGTHQGFADPPYSTNATPNQLGSKLYDAALRKTFPLTVTPNVGLGGSTVTHGRTKNGPITEFGGNKGGTGDTQSNPIHLCHCPITILSSAPPDGSFRPNPYNAPKTIHNISSVAPQKAFFSLRLAVPGPDDAGRSVTPPTLAECLSRLEPLWTECVGKKPDGSITANGDRRQFHGPCLFGNQGHDPNDLNIYSAQAWLRLLLDWTPAEEATRDKVLHNLIQKGIDFYGWCEAGATWGMTTGHQGSGLMGNIAMAATALNYPQMFAMLADTSNWPGTAFPKNAVRFTEFNKTIQMEDASLGFGYNGSLYPPTTANKGTWPETLSAPIPSYVYKGVSRRRIIGCDQWYGISAGAGIQRNADNWLSYINAGTTNSWAGFALILTILKQAHPTISDPRVRVGHEEFFLRTDDHIESMSPARGDLTVLAQKINRFQDVFTAMMWDTYRDNYVTEYPIYTEPRLQPLP